MESSDDALTVLLDDFRFDDERNPVVARCLASLETEHGETTWQTGNSTEHGLESFGEMMRDEVFVDLNSGDP